jgi:hypothetical protein
MVMKNKLSQTWCNFKPFTGLIVFLIILLLVMWVTCVPCPDLWYLAENDFPCHQVPAVSCSGGTLRVSRTVSILSIDGVALRLEDGLAYLPENIPAGWHELEIDGRSRGKILYVAPFSPDNFFWIWVSDIHMHPYGRKKVLEKKRVLDLVNELGPAFVVSGGDQTDFGLEDEYRNYKEAISGLEMPVYNIPGNHETYTDAHLHRYLRELGPTNYSFTFNDYLFVTAAALHAYRSWGGLNGKQLAWLENKFSRPARLKFLLVHIPLAYYTPCGREYAWIPWCRKDNYFTQILEGHDKLMKILRREKVVTFFGHWHTFHEEFTVENLRFFHTPSVTQNSKGVAESLFGTQEPFARGFSFRIVEVENGRLKSIVVDQRKLLIQRENMVNGQRIRILNEHDYFIPMNLKISLGKGEYKVSEGIKHHMQPDGTFWIWLEAKPGITEVLVERT